MSAPAGLSEYSIALKAGTLLVDQYTIVGVLGRPGGFGITYLAEDLRLDTLVAIKEFLPRELVTRAPDHSTIISHSGDYDTSFHRGLEQFLREARTLAKIHHPSVVRVRQFFEANGTAYLVMDYLEGQTLSDLVREAGGRLPAARSVEITMRVLDGLRAAHALNIYHRDVKPANIYITSSGLPVLLDFGAARQATGTSGASMTAVLTPGFAPLEQYGHRGQGPWTDIYATSAVLYHILTGVDPVPATDRVGEEIDPMVSPADIDPAIGQALSDVVMKGLSMAPRSRPQTAPEFQELLREALAEHQRATTAPPILPVLPPETIRATPVEMPRMAALDASPRQTPTPSSPPINSAERSGQDASPVVVSFKVPRRLFGLSLNFALLAVVALMAIVVVFVVTRSGSDVANSIVTGPSDTSLPGPVKTGLTGRTAGDSTSFRLDSARRADSASLAAARKRTDSLALARKRADSVRRADSALLARRHADSVRRADLAALALKRADSIKRADSVALAQRRADSVRADSVRRASARGGGARTFRNSVDDELRALVGLFRARDRGKIAVLLGDDEVDRIFRKLEGHYQVAGSVQVMEANQGAGTAEFFLKIWDQVSSAPLHTGFYTAKFGQFPTGWKLLTATQR